MPRPADGLTVFNTKGFCRGRDRSAWARPTFRRFWWTKPATLYPVQQTAKGAWRQPGKTCPAKGWRTYQTRMESVSGGYRPLP
ncbi:MAG: hypothetical protein ACLUE8_06705 [Lachnospiraceae bacterium]